MAPSTVKIKNSRWCEISPSKHLLGFNGFICTFKCKKLQIYGDRFLCQNIHFAGSKGFGGTFNCLKFNQIKCVSWCKTNNPHLVPLVYLLLPVSRADAN